MRHFLLLIMAVLLSGVAAAQVRVTLNVNVDRQPVWGPTGYDHVEYYYLPDIDVYYNVPRHRFIYFEGGRWMDRTSLPPRYRDYDLYNSYKVVVNEPTPYRNNAAYQAKYRTDVGRHDQQNIRDSRDSRYFSNPSHPEHNTWVQQHRQENGKAGQPGRGNVKGNGRDNGKDHGHGNDRGQK